MKKSDKNFHELKQFLEFDGGGKIEAQLLEFIEEENYEEVPFAPKGVIADGVFLVYVQEGIVKIPYYWDDHGYNETQRVIVEEEMIMVNENDGYYLNTAELYLEKKLEAIRETRKKQRLRMITSSAFEGKGEIKK